VNGVSDVACGDKAYDGAARTYAAWRGAACFLSSLPSLETFAWYMSGVASVSLGTVLNDRVDIQSVDLAILFCRLSCLLVQLEREEYSVCR